MQEVDSHGRVPQIREIQGISAGKKVVTRVISRTCNLLVSLKNPGGLTVQPRARDPLGECMEILAAQGLVTSGSWV